MDEVVDIGQGRPVVYSAAGCYITYWNN